MSQQEWISAFQGRNESLGTIVNFLYRDGCVYVSDNHLAAAWCWLRQPFVLKQHSVLHVDAHYDTRGADAGTNMDLGSLVAADFEEYRSLPHPNDGHVPAFTWDNYLSIYQYLNSDNIEQLIFSTHHQGTAPAFAYEEVEPDQLTERINSIGIGESWIINLDLDFFVSQDGPRYPLEDRPGLYQSMMDLKNRSKNCVVTVALSPECTGSWDASEELLAECCTYMGFNLELPASSEAT